MMLRFLFLLKKESGFFLLPAPVAYATSADRGAQCFLISDQEKTLLLFITLSSTNSVLVAEGA
jgi:hypothetical protein